MNFPELVDSNSNRRNWKGIIISLLVISVIISLVVVAVKIKEQKSKTGNEHKELFSLDDATLKMLEPRLFNGVWINNKIFAYKTSQNNIMLFDCQKLNETLLLSNMTTIPKYGSDFRFFMSGDPNVLLFASETKSLYRHSFNARYKLYNIISKMEFDVIPPDAKESPNVYLQNALLSPNSRKLAFVYHNNIYLTESFFDGIFEAKKITNDGKLNVVYNGVADWLYEEEILLYPNTMWWSPDNKYLAYLKLNDSKVHSYSFPNYGEDNQYLNFTQIRYPKPGTPNPEASVFVYNTLMEDTHEMEVPRYIINHFKDYYIWSITWLIGDQIIIVYVNRKQDLSVTVINNAATGKIILEKRYPSMNSEAWVLPHGLLASYKFGYYFQIWPNEGFKNIIAFDIQKGDVKAITSHNFDVMEILKISESHGEIYYLATNGDPKQRHLFKKDISIFNGAAECITCDNSIKLGPYDKPSFNAVPLDSSKNCLYHSASFSTHGDYYALECLGDRIPIVYIKSAENKSIKHVFEANVEYSNWVHSKILPQKGYLRIVLDEQSNAYADAEVLYPPNFDPKVEPIKVIYPVLVSVYNGPGSQTVDYQFRIRKFESYLSVNFGVIVAFIDGRGTEGNGDQFLKAVYKQLGRLEILDQFSLTMGLRNELYTDNDRFAIWGWSYGGYLSALALFNETSPFRCAISGAPVIDWRYYDSAYSERFLGVYDSQSQKVYDDSSLPEIIKSTDKFFTRRKMLLVHGTGDDNVHFQNSAILAKILRGTYLDFEFDVFPDMKHTPDDVSARYLYQKMTRFLLDCYNMNYHSYYEQLKYNHLIGEPTFVNPYFVKPEPKE